MVRPGGYAPQFGDEPPCVDGQGVATRIYDIALRLLLALLPSVLVGYIAFFQDPSRTLVEHLFHDVAIFIACMTSAFIAYVTCEESSLLGGGHAAMAGDGVRWFHAHLHDARAVHARGRRTRSLLPASR